MSLSCSAQTTFSSASKRHSNSYMLEIKLRSNAHLIWSSETTMSYPHLPVKLSPKTQRSSSLSTSMTAISFQRKSSTLSSQNQHQCSQDSASIWNWSKVTTLVSISCLLARRTMSPRNGLPNAYTSNKKSLMTTPNNGNSMKKLAPSIASPIQNTLLLPTKAGSGPPTSRPKPLSRNSQKLSRNGSSMIRNKLWRQSSMESITKSLSGVSLSNGPRPKSLASRSSMVPLEPNSKSNTAEYSENNHN